MNCPRCGQAGGVLLFTSVAPCDKCMGHVTKVTGHRKWWKIFDIPKAPLSIPFGTKIIIWNAWNDPDRRNEVLGRLPSPDTEICISNDGRYASMGGVAWMNGTFSVPVLPHGIALIGEGD